MNPDAHRPQPTHSTGVLPAVSLPATVVPERLEDVHRDRLRRLLDQTDHWVRRDGWSAYLEGQDVGLIAVADMGGDERVAALAWLRQQRHELHRALVGSRPAPEGWLEERPLYRVLAG